MDHPWLEYTPLVWVPAVPLIRWSELENKQKNYLWRGIKKADPALANMLSNDKALEKLRQTFDAEVVFETTEAEQFIEIGGKQ